MNDQHRQIIVGRSQQQQQRHLNHSLPNLAIAITPNLSLPQHFHHSPRELHMQSTPTPGSMIPSSSFPLLVHLQGTGTFQVTFSVNFQRINSLTNSRSIFLIGLRNICPGKELNKDVTAQVQWYMSINEASDVLQTFCHFRPSTAHR